MEEAAQSTPVGDIPTEDQEAREPEAAPGARGVLLASDSHEARLR